MKKYVYGYYAQKFKNETPPPKKKVNPIPITSNSTNKSDTTTIWLTPYENEMRHAIDEGIRLRRTSNHTLELKKDDALTLQWKTTGKIEHYQYEKESGMFRLITK